MMPVGTKDTWKRGLYEKTRLDNSFCFGGIAVYV